jgi:hypothetical protein
MLSGAAATALRVRGGEGRFYFPTVEEPLCSVGGASVVRVVSQSGSNAFDVLGYSCPEFDGNTMEFFAVSFR